MTITEQEVTEISEAIADKAQDHHGDMTVDKLGRLSFKTAVKALNDHLPPMNGLTLQDFQTEVDTTYSNERGADEQQGYARKTFIMHNFGGSKEDVTMWQLILKDAMQRLLQNDPHTKVLGSTGRVPGADTDKFETTIRVDKKGAE